MGLAMTTKLDSLFKLLASRVKDKRTQYHLLLTSTVELGKTPLPPVAQLVLCPIIIPFCFILIAATSCSYPTFSKTLFTNYSTSFLLTLSHNLLQGYPPHCTYTVSLRRYLILSSPLAHILICNIW
jgi:hypothetical protein